jgi:hypothetical protein
MISDVLADAIAQINQYLGPNYTHIYTGKYLQIIKVRNAMEQLRQELDTSPAMNTEASV